MPRIAVTGHMDLTRESVPLVYKAIIDLLMPHMSAELIGISCIARGADSIFADALLDVGGKLEVVLPAVNYRETKVKREHAAQFDALVHRASKVHTLPFERADRDAYAAANEVLLASCHQLFAIWDGRSGVDIGSTASVVEHAHSRNLPVQVIWPDGAARC